jgi:hypothetical protein
MVISKTKGRIGLVADRVAANRFAESVPHEKPRKMLVSGESVPCLRRRPAPTGSVSRAKTAASGAQVNDFRDSTQP